MGIYSPDDGMGLPRQLRLAFRGAASQEEVVSLLSSLREQFDISRDDLADPTVDGSELHTALFTRSPGAVRNNRKFLAALEESYSIDNRGHAFTDGYSLFLERLKL